MDETLQLVVSVGTPLASAIAAYLITRSKLAAGKKVIEASAADTIQRAAAALVEEQRLLSKDQRDLIGTLQSRVEAVEKDRESLLTQIRALTEIIDSLKRESAKERGVLEQKIAELESRVNQLTGERDQLLKKIESLKQHDSTKSEPSRDSCKTA